MKIKQYLKDDKKFFKGTVFLLLLVSAFAYLPLVHKIGYMNDDWYLMYGAYTQGADFLQEVWQIDRPARAFLMIPLFNIFGETPLLYHLSAYFFRFLSGVSLFWVLYLLWPKKRFFIVLGSLFFTLYPGFLAQTNAIDYQSHVFALFLALLSVALTVKALLVEKNSQRVFFIFGAILLGWGYLSQMEYFISFEIFRLAIVFLLVLRRNKSAWYKKIGETLLVWLPFSAAPGGFLIWRLFFFESSRRATDIGFQLGQLFSSPLIGLWWLVYLVQDFFNVVLVAWGYPLYTIAYQLRLRETLIGFSLAALVGLLIWLGLYWGTSDEEDVDIASNAKFMRDEYWLALVTIIGGLLPIIIVNRHVVFPDFSRYTLVASVGASILLASIISQLSSKSLRIAITGFLAAVAVMTHYANAVHAANSTAEVRDFWWQVSWRVPDIESGTTLLAQYPTSAIQEDYILWGAANLIYRPEKQDQNPIEIDLPSAVLTNEVVLNVITGKGLESPERRGNYLTRSFDDVLFIVQTSPNSCVRLIDGKAPELSSLDSHRTMIVAPYSQIDNILINSEFPTPPETIFGPEPEKRWCYYYQKASLARQEKDWDRVISLLEKALDEGYYPADSIEWGPLLEAYVQKGEQEKLRPYVSVLREEPFLSLQACTTLSKAAKTDEMRTYIEKKFCE